MSCVPTAVSKLEKIIAGYCAGIKILHFDTYTLLGIVT
jgi:hypothetical protein